MKKINLVFSFLFLIVASNLLVAQNNIDKIAGAWKGSLITPNGKLDLIFTITSENNGIATKLDVPLQGAKGIPATSSVFRNDSVIIQYTVMRAVYRGVYNRDSLTLDGMWVQNGYTFALKLYPSKELMSAMKHPQEPLKPYPYNEEQIIINNAGAQIKLAGTFTWPKNKTNCPVAILISGSGPQNRNEELLGHKPFLVLADYLTKNDIAVLRFDDRGVGESTGSFTSATTADFGTDVEAALLYLQTRKEINKNKIGLIGHSEGGMIAPMVASRSKNVAFVVLLAGPGLSGAELLALQSTYLSRASGMDENQIAENMVINKKIYGLILSSSSGYVDSIKAELKRKGLSNSNINQQLEVLESPWYKYFLGLDPVSYLSKTTCPLLALNGKKDLQVPYKENLEAIEKIMKQSGNKECQTKAYEDLNHLFQHCSTGLPSEYAEIEETLSTEVLKDIGDWISKLR
jgi:alpha/beta superfamily hydrolase